MSVQIKGVGTIGGIDQGLNTVGVITATSFVGSGANLTNLPSQVTIASNADNRVITGGSGTNLNGEANLTFDGSKLSIKGVDTTTGSGGPAALEIKQGDANNEFVNLSLQTGSGGPLATISAIADATGVYPNTTGQLRFSTQVGGGLFERMFIKSNGDIGLGESSPNRSGYSSPVTSVGYNSSNGYGVLELLGNQTSDNTIANIVAYNIGGSSRLGAIAFERSGANNSGAIRFETYASGTAGERLRISSSGNVGINENNPTDKLHVNGTTNFVSNSYIGGDLYMYGNSYGNGIFLGGSNAVHKLDYYKKGTWTPSMWRNGHGSEIPLGSGNRFGHYVRVGDLLHISFYWYNPSLSSSNGTYWVVRDLPFNLLYSSGSAYQFIPGGYFYQQGDSTGDSGSNGSYRWQANGTFSANTLTLYAANNSRDANGATEFSGTGTLIVA